MRKVLLLMVGFGGGAVMAALLLHNTLYGFSWFRNEAALSPPFSISQTPMQLLSFEPFDGAYPEDGSGDAVTGVAAVILENTGCVTVKNGAVKLAQGKDILVFSFTMVPPGAKVLVVEKSRKAYSDAPITGCWGWTLEHSGDRRLRISEYGRSRLTVTNLSEQTITSACICFKRYDQATGLYIGGYSYRVELCDLLPGIPKVIPVYRYIAGHTRLVE